MKRPPHNKGKDRPLKSEEKALWRFVTRHDVKLRPEEDIPDLPDISVKPRAANVNPVFLPEISTPKAVKQLDPLSSGAMIGVDRRTMEKLKKGKLPVDRIVDMHGQNQEQACDALWNAIRTAYETDQRVLLVITGKGQRGDGILRTRLPVWLNDEAVRPFILAFTRATPKDGGDGAFYLLLKRRK